MTVAPDPVPRPLDHLALCGRDDDAALVLRGQTLSHRALRSRVATLAGWLAGAVPRPGGRVATWTAKGELACLMPLAAARAGLVHVPINPLLKRRQVAHILADSGAALLLATPTRLLSLEAGDVPPACLALPDTAPQPATALPPSSASPGALAAILYTSGSTGRPKGVMLSHANLWLGAVSVAHYLGLERDDVTLAVLPLSFDYGQNQLLSTWYAGGCVVPHDYLAPQEVLRDCARHRITTLAGVPPLWVQLTEGWGTSEGWQTLRRLTNSGGAMTSALARRLRERAPAAQIHAMYGLTEAFRSTSLDPALFDRFPTSIGTPVPFAEVLIVREDGTLAADGEEGELVHCGPLVAQGYWNDPERTAQRFRPAPAGSSAGGMAAWSGDRARRDADGLFHFCGRDDAMIKSAGHRISPEEIEEVALATGLVGEAAALGVADPALGQAIHLFVRGTGEEAALRAALRQELPGFMMPHMIHFLAAMPLGPNGKIDRAALAGAMA